MTQPSELDTSKNGDIKMIQLEMEELFNSSSKFFYTKQKHWFSCDYPVEGEIYYCIEAGKLVLQLDSATRYMRWRNGSK